MLNRILLPVPHVQLIFLCCQVNQKRRSNKTLKIFVSFKSIWEWLGIFLDRGTALLTVLPDRHDVIACISSASQFNILEANKVKRLVVLNKTYRPFSFMSPPNSIALGYLVPSLIIRRQSCLSFSENCSILQPDQLI